MKTIKFLVMGFLAAYLFMACGSDSDGTIPDPEPVPPVVTQPDELEFKVLVYIDKPSVMGHLGGSERMVTTRMNTLFRQVSNYWNECSHGKLKHKYRYSMADMMVYEGSSNDPAFRKKVYDDPMDFSKYDVVVLFDCKQDNGETGNGGGACGGGKDNRSVITVIAGAEPKDIFNDATYRTLVHELGHYRGVTDLYQYLIVAKDNPVNHQDYNGPIDCVMNWAAAGEWSDYAAKCMNLSAGSKQIGNDFPDFFGQMYPKKLEVTVTVGGQPKRGVKVNLYGSRAGGTNRSRDIWPEVFLSGQTDTNGKYALTDMKQYFVPDRNKFSNLPSDLPYGRWFGFLAEVTYDNVKKYAWMPEYIVQMPFFEGKDTYSVNIAF